MEANIHLNGFSAECELIEGAVSDTSGNIIFYEHSAADGSHSVHQDWAKELKGEMRPIGKVRCLRLSEIVEEKSWQELTF